MEIIRIDLYDLLKTISSSQDLVSPEINSHQQMVAYLAYKISVKMGLARYLVKDIFLASLIHDIGALSEQEKLDIVKQKIVDKNTHAYKGAYLFEEFLPLERITTYIRYHHTPWNKGDMQGLNDEVVPFESNIVNVADYVCTSISAKFLDSSIKGPYGRFILNIIPEIIKKTSEKVDTEFAPEIIDALNKLADNEYVWLDLASNDPVAHVPADMRSSTLMLNSDDIIDIARIFSHIIDFRSEFTSRHSAGVATVAHFLAQLTGFSPIECKMMLIAGYVHDLGKLAISSEILEKPGKLENEEMRVMKSHTYFTYNLLAQIPTLPMINEWASFHHERIDGKGYPFKIKGENMTLGSRIMAIADIFTAITEHRPYRAGMKDAEAMKVLNDMSKTGAIDHDVTLLLLKNFQQANAIRAKAQDEAAECFAEFTKMFS